MKILYVLNSGNPGGMEQHVLDLVTGMVAAGHQVFVWCAEGDIVKWYQTAGAEVEVHSINFEIDPQYTSLYADLPGDKVAYYNGEISGSVININQY